MIYHRFYHSEYADATRGLSLLEHGAYRILLDSYFVTESPLPTDELTLFRLAGAFTADEQSSVRKVIAKYFTLGDDGMYHNSRADKEIRVSQAARSNGAKNGTGTQGTTQMGTQKGTQRGTKIDHPLNLSTSQPKASNYSADFEEAWAAYPRRAGGNAKQPACRAYQARIAAGVGSGDLLAGTRRYAAFCEATGKVGTEYVKQAATFFGPSDHWAEAWAIPAGSVKSTDRGVAGPLDRAARARDAAREFLAGDVPVPRDHGLDPQNEVR